ncbi:MAG TPA: glycosyltransferase family 1 protein, partial [Micromonosporaceae bacterium]
MTDVLILVAVQPSQPAILIEALEKFHAKGARVRLACRFDPTELELDPDLAEVRGFGEAVDRIDSRRRRLIKRAKPPRQVWMYAYHNAWVRQQARQADLLVAADPQAVHAIWEFAQRNLRADAIYGLAASLRALDKRSESAGPSPVERLRRWAPATASIGVRGVRRFGIRAAKGMLRRATGRRVMRIGVGARFWSLTVSAPGLPDRVRSRLAEQVHRNLVRAGQAPIAERTAAATASRIRDPQTRADLLFREASAELRLGRVPMTLEPALTALLSVADSHLKKKDPQRAAAALSKALTLTSSRVLHFDRLTSPLAADPEAFFAPLRRSTAAKALAAPRGRAMPAAPRPTGRPLRLLLTTLINDNFLGEIRERYEQLPGVEVRFLDLHADPSRRWLTRGGLAIMEHILAGHSSYAVALEEWLRPHLDWADTVFIDWCVASAAMFTVPDPGDTRMIVRLHSFETFSLWPHLVDFSRIDDMVFVSDHLRDLSTAVFPHLLAPSGP